MSINNFDGIAYINLDHREDRKKHILDTLQRLDVDKSKVNRISGIFTPFNGHLGCVCSHMKVIDWAIEKKLNTVLVLEDDCYFMDDTSFVNHAIDYFFKIVPTWDVFMLGGYFKKIQKSKYPYITRVKQSYRAHSYGVTKNYLPILKKHFIETENVLKELDTHYDAKSYALDRRWHSLQKKDLWYANNIMLTGQMDGYSDIEWFEKNKR